MIRLRSGIKECFRISLNGSRKTSNSSRASKRFLEDHSPKAPKPSLIRLVSRYFKDLQPLGLRWVNFGDGSDGYFKEAESEFDPPEYDPFSD